MFRCDDTNRRMRIHAGFSVDGIDWDIREEDFKLVGGDTEIGQWVYGYDPRVAKIGDKYYVTWCNGYHGPTIGVAWTEDFETFHQLETVCCFPARSAGNSRCFRVRATTGIRRSATFSIPSRPTWSSGDATAT